MAQAKFRKKKDARTAKKLSVVTVRLSSETHAELVEARNKTGISIQALLELAIKRFVARHRSGKGATSSLGLMTERTRQMFEKVRSDVLRVEGLLASVVSSEDLVSVRLREFADTTPATIALKDSGARVVWANSAFKTRAGAEQTALKGRSMSEIFADDAEYAGWIAEMERETIQSRQHRILIGPVPGSTGGRFRATLCFPMNDRTGEVRLATIGFDLGSSGPDSEARHHLVVTRRNYFSVLTEGEDSARWGLEFLDAIPAAVVIKSLDLKIVWANRTYLKMTGKTLDAIRGKRVGELWADKESAQIIEKNDRDVLESRRTTVREEGVRVMGETQKRLRIRFPISIWDGSIGFLGAIGFDKSQIADEIVQNTPDV